MIKYYNDELGKLTPGGTTWDLFILNSNQGYFAKGSEELLETKLKHKIAISDW